MKDITFLGDVVDCCGSVNNDCSGVADDGARARESVCRKDAKERTLDGDVDGCGDGGRLVCVGDMGGAPRTVLAFDADPFAFFLPAPNDRRKDHSDSNWMASNSLESGE